MRMRRIISSYVAWLLYRTFPHCHKRRDFWKLVIEHQVCVLIFSTTFVRNISHSNKNSARNHKCTYVFMWSTHYSCQILLKLQFSRQLFEKYSNTTFHENPFSASRVAADVQTQLIAAFLNFAKGSNSGVLNYPINLIIPIQITGLIIDTHLNKFRIRYKKQHLTYMWLRRYISG